MSASVDDIFQKAKKGKRLFLDRKTLTPEFVPDHLPYREKQMAQIAEILAPALHSSKPSNLLLYGKTGTGKTAVAKLVTSKLQQNSDNAVILPYVNTKTAETVYRTVREIGLALGLEEIPETGLSIGAVVDKIFEAIRKNSLHVILILDEIDSLVSTHNDNILYDFTRAAERTSPGFLSLVGISNDLRFKENLDPRVLSSLGEEELVFPPYTTEELRSILAERTQSAFRSGVVPESTLNLCAALAGREHGDARRAVDLLRIAGDVADREGRQRIDEDCLQKASEKAEHDQVEEGLRSLPLQNKIIILAASKFPSGTNTGELYLAYVNLAKKTGFEVLTQRRVSGILAELDLLGLVDAAIVSKGRRGRTKHIMSLVDNDVLSRVIKEDAQLLELI